MQPPPPGGGAQAAAARVQATVALFAAVSTPPVNTALIADLLAKGADANALGGDDSTGAPKQSVLYTLANHAGAEARPAFDLLVEAGADPDELGPLAISPRELLDFSEKVPGNFCPY